MQQVTLIDLYFFFMFNLRCNQSDIDRQYFWQQWWTLDCIYVSWRIFKINRSRKKTNHDKNMRSKISWHCPFRRLSQICKGSGKTVFSDPAIYYDKNEGKAVKVFIITFKYLVANVTFLFFIFTDLYWDEYIWQTVILHGGCTVVWTWSGLKACLF